MKFGIVLFILTFAFFAGAKSKPTAKKRVIPVKKAAPVTPGPAQKPVAPNPKPVVPAPLIQTQDSVVHDVQDDLLGILLSGQIADYRGCKLLNGAFICDRKEINTKMVDPFGNELPTMLMANDELVCMLKNGFVSCTGNTWENDPYESKYGSQFDNADPQMEPWKKVFQEDGDVLWIGNGNMDPTKDETSYNGEFCWLKPSGFYCKSSYQTPLAGVSSIRQLQVGKLDGCAIDEMNKLLCGVNVNPGDFDSAHYLQFPTEAQWNESFGCAIDHGQVKCWGNDTFGQLDVPLDLISPHGLQVGKNHACVVSQGNVRCWGSNSDGQLDPPAKYKIQDPDQLILMGNSTCVFLRGGLFCWGDSEGRNAFSTELMLGEGPVLEVLPGPWACFRTNFKVRCNQIKDTRQQGLESLAYDADKLSGLADVQCEDLLGGQSCTRHGLREMKWDRKPEAASALVSYLSVLTAMDAEVQLTPSSLILIAKNVVSRSDYQTQAPVDPKSFAHPVWLRLKTETPFQDLQKLAGDLRIVAGKSSPLGATVLLGLAGLLPDSSSNADRYFVLSILRPYMESNGSAIFKTQMVPAYEQALGADNPQQAPSLAVVAGSVQILVKALRPLADQAGQDRIDAFMKNWAGKNPGDWQDLRDQMPFLTGLLRGQSMNFVQTQLEMCLQEQGTAK